MTQTLETGKPAIKNTHLWQIDFTAKLPESCFSPEDFQAGEQDGLTVEYMRTIADTISVMAGTDGQFAVDLARVTITGQNQMEIQLTDFKLIGLRLLGVAAVQ